MHRHPFLTLFYILNVSILILHGLNSTSFSLWLNLSSSLPYGIYRLHTVSSKQNIGKDDTVLFCLQKNIAQKTLAPQYLDAGSCELNLAPIGKKVIATEGDVVTVNDYGIYINGSLIRNSARQFHLRGQEDLNITERRLFKDEYVVASEQINSFDSRYFGVIQKQDIRGTLSEVLVQKKSQPEG